MEEFLRWEKKKFLRLSRNLEVTARGTKYGWGKAARQFAGHDNMWSVVAQWLNEWWDNLVFDGCTAKKWDEMYGRLKDNFGIDATIEFEALFPKGETVGDLGASALQKKIYKLGNKASRGTDVDLADVVGL